ncbi:hypothetical protein BV25DRAFT_1789848, partial [Artomyces pyxidatus]
MSLSVNTQDSLIAALYLDIAEGNKSDQYFLDRTILCSKNDAAADLNQAILDKFPGQEHTHMSVDKV